MISCVRVFQEDRRTGAGCYKGRPGLYGDALDAARIGVLLGPMTESRPHPRITDLDPVGAIRAHMDVTGRKQADLTHLLGSSSRPWNPLRSDCHPVF